MITTTESTAGRQRTCIHQLCFGAVMKHRNDVNRRWTGCESLCRWGKKKPQETFCVISRDNHTTISDSKHLEWTPRSRTGTKWQNQDKSSFNHPYFFKKKNTSLSAPTKYQRVKLNPFFPILARLCNILTPVQQHDVGGVLGCYLTVRANCCLQASQRIHGCRVGLVTTIQHVVGDGGRRVITIVMEKHGKRQPAGQQSEWAVSSLQRWSGPER